MTEVRTRYVEYIIVMILLALRSTCFSYKPVSVDCLKPVTLLLIFIVAWGTSGDNTQYCCLDMFFISA